MNVLRPAAVQCLVHSTNGLFVLFMVQHSLRWLTEVHHTLESLVFLDGRLPVSRQGPHKMTPEKPKRALSVVHGLNRDHISTRIQRAKKRKKFAAREGKLARNFPSGPHRSGPSRFLGLGPHNSDPTLWVGGVGRWMCVSGSPALRLSG